MITNIIKDKNGNTTQWTDTKDNRTTKVANCLYTHFCSSCGTPENEMKFLSEYGYYDRTITMKCKCNKIVKYHG